MINWTIVSVHMNGESALKKKDAVFSFNNTEYSVGQTAEYHKWLGN